MISVPVSKTNINRHKTGTHQLERILELEGYHVMGSGKSARVILLGPAGVPLSKIKLTLRPWREMKDVGKLRGPRQYLGDHTPVEASKPIQPEAAVA